jgi:mRNA interferase YafO
VHAHARKVSDKALVYVSDLYHGHLLLFILDEPQAHQIARMQTPEDEELMKAFAAVADRFIQTGEITA